MKTAFKYFSKIRSLFPKEVFEKFWKKIYKTVFNNYLESCKKSLKTPKAIELQRILQKILKGITS